MSQENTSNRRYGSYTWEELMSVARTGVFDDAPGYFYKKADIPIDEMNLETVIFYGPVIPLTPEDPVGRSIIPGFVEKMGYQDLCEPNVIHDAVWSALQHYPNITNEGLAWCCMHYIAENVIYSFPEGIDPRFLSE